MAVTAVLSLLSTGAGCRGAAAPTDDTLRIGIAADAGPLNPYSGSSSALLGFVFDKLFEPSPYIEDPFPALALAAEQLDPSTWRVRLRPDVTWHDGTPFRAEDVVFTFEYYRDGPPNRYAHHVSEVPRIDGIVAEDESTVRFDCGYPCPTLARITLADLPIIPAHVWRGITDPREHGDLPVGTGPYRLVEYRPDRFYRFEANADYAFGAPAVTTLLMPVIPNRSTALLALRTGEIDATDHELPPELEDEFAGDPELGIAHTSTLTIVELRPNYRRPPFDEAAMRRALSLAVDRREIVDVVLLGQARPGTSGYPHPDSPWTAPDLATPHDPEAARALLDELGYGDRDGDGVREHPTFGPLRLDLAVDGGRSSFLRVAGLLQEQLGDLGLDVTVETMEAVTLTALVQSRDFDLFLSEIGAHGVADPDQFIMSHRSGYLWSRDMPHPEWDALFPEWRRAETVGDRLEVSFRMQRLFNRQPTSIALYYPQKAFAYRRAAYDGWVESLGYGIIHKWSLVDSPRR